MKILAIETSCDETAAAVVEDGTKILSNVVASSTAMHEKYGGIVPEVAAREQLKCIIPVITESLKPFSQTNSTLLHRSVELQSQWIKETILRSIDAIAVTVGPGLIGSLLVGVEAVRTIAFATGKPIIPVNHVIAHMYANFLDSNRENSSRAKEGASRYLPKSRGNLIEFPAISLVVSGGHTELYLMKSIKDLTWLGGTLDDAAGECFDKTARLLGFGHGGGVAIQTAAGIFQHGNILKSSHIKLPRPMINDESFNFSFSGLKTAVMREWKKSSFPVIPAFTLEGQAGIQTKKNTGSPTGTGMTKTNINEELANMFAYEIQESITDVLVEKTLHAAKQYGAKSILLSGGVAANQRLREKFSTKLETNEVTKLSLHAPPISLCTDNAVYIGASAYFLGHAADWHEITAVPDLSVEIGVEHT